MKLVEDDHGMLRESLVNNLSDEEEDSVTNDCLVRAMCQLGARGAIPDLARAVVRVTG